MSPLRRLDRPVIPFLDAAEAAFAPPSARNGSFLHERIYYPAVRGNLAGTEANAVQRADAGTPGARARRRLSVYTRDELAAIRDAGFTAVWAVAGPLRNLVRTSVFPTLGEEQDATLGAVREVLETCHAVGLGLYLYFLEPAFLYEDHPFWKEHPEAMGDRPCEDVHPSVRASIPRDEIALCTSTPQVRDFLREGFAALGKALPGLRGTIHISATESLTHCWSHAWRKLLPSCRCWWPEVREPNCPRCRERAPAEVVGELLGCFRDGLHAADPAIRVIAWNWDWCIYGDDPQAEMVEAVPEGVTFMADFERGGWKESFGRHYLVDEYSLSYIGPSRRFLDSTALARKKGREIFAKLQIGAAHDLGSVPNLPLVPNLQQKLAHLYRLGVEGTMATWDFGCDRTLNTFVMKAFCDDPHAGCEAETFLASVAEAYFGEVDPVTTAHGWKLFCQAFDLYPFTQRFAYYSPIHNAPAYPLHHDYRAAPMDAGGYYNEAHGDRMRDTLIRFAWEDVIARLEEMERLWRRGLALYEEALAEGAATGEQERHRAEELSVARIVPIHLRGTWNAYRLHRWKMLRAGEELWDAPRSIPLDAEAVSILRDEIENARAALPLCREDPRLGYHLESQCYLYDEAMIRRKIETMEATLGGAG